MTPHAEKFAPDGERSSQMLSTSCALQIEIDRLRSKADIGLGELLDMPFERHEGLGRQRDVGNKDRIVARKLGVAVERPPGVDCAFGVAEPIKLYRMEVGDGWL